MTTKSRQDFIVLIPDLEAEADRLESEVRALDEEMDEVRARKKATGRELATTLDQLRVYRRIARMSDAEFAALRQVLGPAGIPSEEAVGETGSVNQ